MAFDIKRLMVTGANGFVGCTLCAEASAPERFARFPMPVLVLQVAARLLDKADFTRIMWFAAGGYQKNTGGVRVGFSGEYGCCAKSDGAEVGQLMSIWEPTQFG